MVYLVNYRMLHKAPGKTTIKCLEKRKDEKFECFTPLMPSLFVKDLIRQRRIKHALKEMTSLSNNISNKEILSELKKGNQNLILVSWEEYDSPLTKIREELLNKWKIEYKIIQGEQVLA